MNFILKTMLLSVVSLNLFAAEDFDKASREAVEEVQHNMTNVSAREKSINENANTRAADRQLTELVGNGALKQESYQLSADIFKYLIDKHAGDPVKAQEELLKAMKDPKAFLGTLPDNYKDKIRQIAAEVEAKNKKP